MTATRPLLRVLAAALLGALLGCSGAKSRVLDDTGDFPHHRCVGVAPFADPRGQGRVVADLIESGLQQLMYEPVDQKALAEVLADIPGRGPDLGLEALEKIHRKVPVDAIIFGRIAPDWSLVTITVNDTEMGGPILQAVLRPVKKKSFSDPADIAREAIRLLASLR
jgi:hypothetical protein